MACAWPICNVKAVAMTHAERHLRVPHFSSGRRNGEVFHGGNPNSDHKKSISKSRGWVPEEVGAHRVASR